MEFAPGEARRLIFRVVLSISVSAVLLALLIRLTLSSADPAVWSGLAGILTTISGGYILLYLSVSLIKTLLQALRYRMLLRTSEAEIPTLFHLYLVTLSRNMFVDMLPARLGELSYIAMLNRGYRVRARSCVSSLAISFIFDLLALGVLILGLILLQILRGEFQGWMAGTLVMLCLLILFLFILLYPALTFINKGIRKISFLQSGVLAKGFALLAAFEEALRDTRQAGIGGRLLFVSLGVRLAKYTALYLLFVGVAASRFPDMTTDMAVVFPALVSAEAGASLPVPAFMGFGTYEAGGTFALVVLGLSQSASLLLMLGIHAISQVIDYVLGGIGLILFIFKAKYAARHPVRPGAGLSYKFWLSVLFILGIAGLFLVFEMWQVRKRGTLIPPDRGSAIDRPGSVHGQSLDKMEGFIVWSSNRSGNHDLYLFSLPDRRIRRLTSHPHSEYYPRISPDGRYVVFCRGHEPWVSQRNVFAWDVWQLDLETGEERLLAKNGNVPTWSSDGTKVFFQRNAEEVVELRLNDMKEKTIYKSAVNVNVPVHTVLETPDISRSGGRLAVTLRKTMRATAIVEPDGSLKKTGNGCQLNWGPRDRYLYKIDHGGRKENAIFKIDPNSLRAEMWFDAPGPYSHEYFPKVANTEDVLVYGASAEGHEHDTADYEIFLWVIGQPYEQAQRITYHTGNDCWPDIFLKRSSLERP